MRADELDEKSQKIKFLEDDDNLMDEGKLDEEKPVLETARVQSPKIKLPSISTDP